MPSPTIREYVPGTTIAEPGIYLGVPMEAYHGQKIFAGPSISSSGLRTIFGDSLAHYYRTSPINPKAEEVEQSEAMVLGRAAHHLLLGEPAFRKHFILRPDNIDGEPWQGNRKSCKAWLAMQEMAGLTVVTPKQIEAIRRIAENMAEEPLIRGGALSGITEASLVWQDEETGLWLKARPDAWPVDSADAFDLKVTAELDDDSLERNLFQHGYHQQGALVAEGYRVLTGRPLENFTLVYAEAKEPHCIRVERISDEDLAIGAAANRAALRLFARALKTGYWPGPKSASGDVGILRLPKWARDRSERRIAIINAEFGL